MADQFIPSRDEIVARYKQSYLLYLPDADVRDGEQPDIDARTLANLMLPLYAKTEAVASSELLSGKTLDQLLEVGAEEQVAYQGAVGASGYVLARTSTGGGWVYAGDECKDTRNGWRYTCAESRLYQDGDSVPAVGFDTGPGTNQVAGTVLQWSSPRAGVLPLASVDSSGLTGGREAMTADEYRRAIIDARASRAKAAEYVAVIAKTPGVSVQQAFAYPGVAGPGTIAWTFTVNPPYPGGSRVPSAAQLALVDAWVAGQMPSDDSSVGCPLLTAHLSVSLGITWSEGSLGWANQAPWPSFAAMGGTPGPVVVSASSGPTSFTLSASSYSGIMQPSVGTVVAFYDAAATRFRHKQIKTITGSGPWAITCETVGNASDTSYQPLVGQRCSPWSADAQSVIPAVTSYVDSTGPGEQRSQLPPDGRRMRRTPAATFSRWPIDVGTRLASQIPFSVSAVGNCSLLARSPQTVPVGSPCAYSALLQLTDLSVYPEP